jgi:hypothetical protein
MICGGISALFLKAGLIVLESKQIQDSSSLVFYTLAFIAGLNVDNFIKKIEEISKTTFGIRASRVAREESKGD